MTVEAKAERKGEYDDDSKAESCRRGVKFDDVEAGGSVDLDGLRRLIFLFRFG